MCWLFWLDWTTPHHSLTVPQVQIGGRPIASSIASTASSAASVANRARRCGIRLGI